MATLFLIKFSDLQVLHIANTEQTRPFPNTNSTNKNIALSNENTNTKNERCQQGLLCTFVGRNHFNLFQLCLCYCCNLLHYSTIYGSTELLCWLAHADDDIIPAACYILHSLAISKHWYCCSHKRLHLQSELIYISRCWLVQSSVAQGSSAQQQHVF